MKLRNKKTGHIIECSVICSDENLSPRLIESNEGRPITLAELNEEWEDYEEPKGWSITMYGGISRITKDDEILISDLKEIGNYFNDKESAYEALDKLKAWKRLEDKGFKFDGYNACSVDYDIDEQYRKYISQDLDLLFRGEE